MTQETFMESDLAKDIQEVVLQQLIKGYDCIPKLELETYISKRSGIEYYEYSISFIISNKIQTQTQKLIFSKDYYHPLRDGYTNEKTLRYEPLKRLSDVNLEHDIKLSKEATWDGDLSNTPDIS